MGIFYTVGNADADFLVGDYATFSHAVAAALAAGDVFIKAGTYTVPAAGSVVILPISNRRVVGAGIGRTIIQTARTDYVFKNTSPISDFWMENLTIDCQNLANVNALEFRDATRSGCRRVEFKNSAKWFAKLGSEPSASSAAYCVDCEFDSCIFDAHSSAYEMLLIWNAKNTWIRNCVFKNNAANSPTLGLWQKTEGTHITGCKFVDCAEKAIYYGVTCNDTWVTNCTFDNCGAGLQGANVPDNGLFGTTTIRNLRIEGCLFIGGVNSASAYAIQIGAVNGWSIANCKISAYERGIVIGYGNSTIIGGSPVAADFSSVNGTIVDCEIKNSNPSGTSYGIHNAIVFNRGGTLNISVVNTKIFDDQATKTLRYPVSFNASGETYGGVVFVGCQLSADTANGGTSVIVNNAATVLPSVSFLLCTDFTATAMIKGNANIPLAAPLIDTIKDINGNTVLGITPVASAVDYPSITNAAAGSPTVTYGAGGVDANVNVVVASKGGGIATVRPGANGTNAVRIQNAAGSSNILVADTTNLRVAIAQTTPTAILDLAPATTAHASLRLRAGAAPSAPNDGDLWYDGVHLYSRVNGVSCALDRTALFDHYADAGNTTTTQTDLYNDSVTANTLAVNGDKLSASYGGIFVGSATATRRLRLYFGGTAIFDSGALSVNPAASWTLSVLIIRASVSVVRYQVTLRAAATASTATGELTGLVLANDNALRLTGTAAGTGAATNDIVARMGTVELKRAA